jgi:hypothetical protein
MTEGEVCLDYAKMAETQRQTQLDHALAAKKVLFKRKRDSWFQNEGRLAIIGAEFRSHMGNVGLYVSTVRRHINWNTQRPDLRENLAHLVDNIKRRVCGIASAGSPSFSV